MSPANWSATGRPSAPVGGHAGLRHQRGPLRRRRRHRALSAPEARSPPKGLPLSSRAPCRVDEGLQHDLRSCRSRARALSRRDRRRGARLSRRHRRAWSAKARTVQQLELVAVELLVSARCRGSQPPEVGSWLTPRLATDRAESARHLDEIATRERGRPRSRRTPARAGRGGARQEIRTKLTKDDAVRQQVKRVALPRFTDHGEFVRFCAARICPGSSPSPRASSRSSATTRTPARMFAGEGDPARTNRRFKVLSAGSPATRLSTAFDSVTSMAATPTRDPTSTARSAPRASRWRRWMT
jgi:methylmalonyl-CoA mutase